MNVYRISATQYTQDVTGEGARLFGGRWNNPLTACIYTSQSIALAILEYTVNVNVNQIPRGLSIVTFSIGETDIVTIPEKNLPGNWKEMPAPASTKQYGTTLIQKHAIIKIPSVIVPSEHNYLINPKAKGTQLKIIDVQDFVYDLRIKRV